MRYQFILILLLFSFTSFAQQQKHTIIYMTGGAGVGNFYGPSLGVELGIADRYSLGFTYYDHKKLPANRPSDYKSGITGMFSFWGNVARDHLQSYAFTGGIYLPTQSEKSRWHLKAGIVREQVSYPVNWEKINNSQTDENYNYTIRQKNTWGILLNPTYEITLYRVFGLAAGPYLLLNKEKSSVGIEVNYLLGSLH